MLKILTTDEFNTWFASLRDKVAVAHIRTRVERASLGNFGDCSPVGGGVAEMRIHYGPGYRVYFSKRGTTVVILLAGGEKSSQSKDIKTAIKLVKSMREKP
ncbi:type II toxin-antitoxin system RelE/ParE family toxin [Pseudoduganella aquatica]|uniref:Type II toxin-antitoxin system RelE/ParE family toxin n=1 Tax=Pseudoduganella aquatica TaxID=2660641 RepID=A0A7X4HFX8_9BURK|nr:type II toxin-antitoxin system RelE/ParE family toxin [Pseudoduganella aquatica]MYN10219.1 type II toxin-antitoxin system RelE/ParE family toxin [Pseudoduganella aquatica]